MAPRFSAYRLAFALAASAAALAAPLPVASECFIDADCPGGSVCEGAASPPADPVLVEANLREGYQGRAGPENFCTAFQTCRDLNGRIVSPDTVSPPCLLLLLLHARRRHGGCNNWEWLRLA